MWWLNDHEFSQRRSDDEDDDDDTVEPPVLQHVTLDKDHFCKANSDFEGRGLTTGEAALPELPSTPTRHPDENETKYLDTPTTPTAPSTHSPPSSRRQQRHRRTRWILVTLLVLLCLLSLSFLGKRQKNSAVSTGSTTIKKKPLSWLRQRARPDDDNDDEALPSRIRWGASKFRSLQRAPATDDVKSSKQVEASRRRNKKNTTNKQDEPSRKQKLGSSAKKGLQQVWQGVKQSVHRVAEDFSAQKQSLFWKRNQQSEEERMKERAKRQLQRELKTIQSELKTIQSVHQRVSSTIITNKKDDSHRRHPIEEFLGSSHAKCTSPSNMFPRACRLQKREAMLREHQQLLLNKLGTQK